MRKKKSFLFMVDNSYSCIDVVYPELSKLSEIYSIDIVFKEGKGRDFAKSIINSYKEKDIFGEIIQLPYDSNKSISSFISSMSKIKEILKSSEKKYEFLIIGSSISFEEKYILNFFLSNRIKVFGLVTSMPVMLIREPILTIKNLKKSILLSCFRENLTPLKEKSSSEVSDFLSKLKKISIKKILNKVISLLISIYFSFFKKIFLDSRLKNEVYSNITGYLPRNVVDKHIVANKFWEFCIREFYPNERTISFKNHNLSKPTIPLSIPKIEKSLLILGPTDKFDSEIIFRDVINLIKIFDIKNINIRAHPRFRQISIDLSKKLYTLNNKISIEVRPEDETLAQAINSNKIILSYYSSAFELQVPERNKIKIVSEEWNKIRYKKVKIELISGACCGFKESFSYLNSKGVLYCPIRRKRKETLGVLNLSSILLKE